MRFVLIVTLFALSTTQAFADGLGFNTPVTGSSPYFPPAGPTTPYAPSVSAIPPSGNISSLPMPQVSPAAQNYAFQNGLQQMNALKKFRLLRHRFAVGVDSVPGITPPSAAGPALAVPRALDLRWWAGDRLGFDLLLAGNYNTQQTGKGVLSPLVSDSPGDAVYGGGLGLRYNVSEPNHDLLAQIVLKATGAQAVESVSGLTGQVDATTLAAFLGAGFEAFIPGWDWLSVEGQAGVTAFSESLTPQGAGPGKAQTLSGLGLAGSGYSPLNLSVHVYF